MDVARWCRFFRDFVDHLSLLENGRRPGDVPQDLRPSDLSTGHLGPFREMLSDRCDRCDIYIYTLHNLSLPQRHWWNLRNCFFEGRSNEPDSIDCMC